MQLVMARRTMASSVCQLHAIVAASCLYAALLLYAAAATPRPSLTMLPAPRTATVMLMRKVWRICWAGRNFADFYSVSHKDS